MFKSSTTEAARCTMALLALAAASCVPAEPAGTADARAVPGIWTTPIRVAVVGTDLGNRAAYQVFAEGDLVGGGTHVDVSSFNSMSAEELRARFDVLLITWATASRLNADWGTRLQRFLALRGGIIFEDPLNLADLNPAVVSPQRFPFQGTFAVSAVPGLTDGISNEFLNNHAAFGAWDPQLGPFLRVGSAAVGLHGGFPGGGRMVVTGTDQHFHGEKHSRHAYERNAYQLLRNELCWVAGCVNQAPVAKIGFPRTFECIGRLTDVALDGSGSSDTDRDVLTYIWTGSFGSLTGPTPTALVHLPLGVHEVVLSVADALGARGTEAGSFSVVDTQAPAIHIAVPEDELWAPDHKLYLVATVAVSDACATTPSVEVSVASSEPGDAQGDGSTRPDWQVIQQNGAVGVWARAERSGQGEGRTYTVTAKARDTAGNTATKEIVVQVRHNR